MTDLPHDQASEGTGHRPLLRREHRLLRAETRSYKETRREARPVAREGASGGRLGEQNRARTRMWTGRARGGAHGGRRRPRDWDGSVARQHRGCATKRLGGWTEWT